MAAMTSPTLPWLSDAPALTIEPDGEDVTRVEGSPEAGSDPGALMLTCANCGAAMDERKCKLICRCGYFLSCSDYY
jgi:hypothetical protein